MQQIQPVSLARLERKLGIMPLQGFVEIKSRIKDLLHL